ncbi:MAG: response regulator [Candidatus Omnitrophota bacterium]
MAKSILVIDDDKLVLLTVKRLLLREGYDVSTALSGAIALKKMEGADFDLIVSDIKMPNMDGIETVRKIREQLSQSGKKPVPEIFITAYAQEDIYHKALTLNAAGYIEKPFDVKTLVQTVRRAIGDLDSANAGPLYN